MTVLSVGRGVTVTALSKRYGETQALDGLSLAAESGQVVGIAGPNGAGKSTLVKILAGEVSADAGEIHVDGEPWSPALSAERVAIVHQEPLLFPNLTVADNLLVGREPGAPWRPRCGATETTLLQRFGILGLADRPLASVPLAVQQRVEIARALARDARVVLFDEPNSALTEEESAELFRTLHALAADGRAVIVVSHRLAELVAHAHLVHVILDGRVSETLSGDALTETRLAQAITVVGDGRRVGRATRGSSAAGLHLRDWRHPRGVFGPTALSADLGEIVAVVGVEGSGAREFIRSIPGFEGASGTISVMDASGVGESTARTGYVPPDRRSALFFNFTVGENVVTRLDRAIRSGAGLHSRSRSMTAAREWISSLSIKTSGTNAWIGSLSGGNQQKVLIASAMAPRPPVLILEEPTRGVDIGSKRDIYAYLRRYADDGAVVILYCTEVPEVFAVADRLYVMSAGRLSPPLTITDFADEKALAAEVARLESSARKDRNAAV